MVGLTIANYGRLSTDQLDLRSQNLLRALTLRVSGLLATGRLPRDKSRSFRPVVR